MYTQYFKENPEKVKGMIGNTFFGRSGSFLLCSLFDNHPQILNFPQSNWTYFTKLLAKEIGSFEEKSSVEFTNHILDNIPYLTEEGNANDPWSIINSPGTIIQQIGEESGANIKIGPKRKILVKELTEIFDIIKKEDKSLNLATLINALHVGYALALKRKITSKNVYILYGLHDYEPEVIQMLSKEYPKFTLMISIRHPASTFDSHLYHHLFESPHSDHMWTLGHLYRTLYFSGQKVRGLTDSQQIGVKFEDVHEKTEVLMKALCRHFSLKWDPILLKSTMDGKIWWAKRNGRLISGPNSKVMIKSHKYKILKKIDLCLFSYLFDAYISTWNFFVVKRNLKSLIFQKFFFHFPFLMPQFLKGVRLEFKKVKTRKDFYQFYQTWKLHGKEFKVLIKTLRPEDIKPIPLFKI